jgi:hypothetical protein
VVKHVDAADLRVVVAAVLAATADAELVAHKLSRLAVGEEKLGRFADGRSKYYWLYLYSGKLILAAIYLRRVRVAGRIFAADAPPLTLVSTAITPPAPAAQKSRRGPLATLPGEGAWPHAWGDGALRPCTARLAAERANGHMCSKSVRFLIFVVKLGREIGGGTHHAPRSHQTQKKTFSPGGEFR